MSVTVVRMILRMAQNDTCDYGLFPDAAAARAHAHEIIVQWCADDDDQWRRTATPEAVLAEWTAGCGEVFDIVDATKELN